MLNVVGGIVIIIISSSLFCSSRGMTTFPKAILRIACTRSRAPVKFTLKSSTSASGGLPPESCPFLLMKEAEWRKKPIPGRKKEKCSTEKTLLGAVFRPFNLLTAHAHVCHNVAQRVLITLLDDTDFSGWLIGGVEDCTKGCLIRHCYRATSPRSFSVTFVRGFGLRPINPPRWRLFGLAAGWG